MHVLPDGSNDVKIHREFGCFDSDAYDDPNFWRLLDGMASKRGPPVRGMTRRVRNPESDSNRNSGAASTVVFEHCSPSQRVLHQFSQALEHTPARHGCAAPCARELNPRLT
jgi:hypothetical protein